MLYEVITIRLTSPCALGIVPIPPAPISKKHLFKTFSIKILVLRYYEILNFIIDFFAVRCLCLQQR